MTIIFNKKKPFVEGVCLNKLTSKIRTPFYVYSQKCIADNYNKISKSLNANIKYDIISKKLELYPTTGKFDFIVS